MNTPRRAKTRVLKQVMKASHRTETPPTPPDISRNSFSSQQLSLSSMGSFGSFRDIPDTAPLFREKKTKQKKEKKKAKRTTDKLSKVDNDFSNSFKYFEGGSFESLGEMANFGDFGNDDVDKLFPQQALSVIENPPITERGRRPESSRDTIAEFASFSELMKKTSSQILNKDLIHRYTEGKKNQQQTKLLTKGRDDGNDNNVANDLEAAIDELLVASRKKAH